VTQQHAAGSARSRGRKTWSALGDLGRRPTEYEILTHGMNHTLGDPPLDFGPDVHANRWLREHRDAIALAVPDWDAFRDPDTVTYGSYVAMQDDQETYVEGLLERFDRDRHDEALGGPTLDLLALALTPCRYLAHAQQMLSAYVQQLAPSSYIATCAVFQTADQLRRVQLLAYRTTQLQRTYPDRDFATGERTTWQSHPDWQPIRKAVEVALVEYDWDRALVASQLVVKPVADAIFLEQLGRELAAIGATLDALILENLWRDAERSQRWTAALLQFLEAGADGNHEVLQGYLDQWAPHGRAMIASGSQLLARAGGRTAEEIADAAAGSWQRLLAPAGLTAGRPLLT
jgi:toluene monooxygenase system protein E